jgi:hypothetical protein
MNAGKSFGRGLGGGLARGFGMSSGGIAARGMAGAMGAVGGVAAGIAAPLAVLQASTAAAEIGVFNPYMNTRRSSEDLRSNFSGITFGDSTGNVITGGGLGGRESSGIASEITRGGIRDMQLSTGEYGNVANMVGRSGLMDNVNSKQISKRVKDSVEQMKLIMSIANMPEMQDAIEQLSKMQKMGANVTGGAFSDASSTMRQLGSLASVAGTNVQKLMNTVGAQGQYLYQANGMTPHLGQLAAANSYASLSAGNRMGLISSAQMARMGGLEGATQASLTGQINASQTMYNKLSNYNSYLGGGSTGSMIGNISKFGQNMAGDPMGAYGGLMLYGRQMAGRQISEQGSLAVENQIKEMLKNQPGMVDKKTGKISIERAAPFLMQMGMSEDQIQAFAAQRISEKDKGTYDLSLKAMNRTLVEQQQQLVEKNDWYGGAIGRSVRSAKRFGRGVTEGVAEVSGIPMANLTGSISDTVGAAWNNMWFNDSIKSSGTTIDKALGGSDAQEVQGFDYTAGKVKFSDGANYEQRNKEANRAHQVKYAAKDLNALKDKGDPDAIKYFTATTAAERQKALDNITRKGKWGSGNKDYLSDPANYKNIEAELSKLPRLAASGKKDDGFLQTVSKSLKAAFGVKEEKVKTFKETLNEMGGLKGQDEFSNLQASGLAYNAANKITDGESLSTGNIADRLSKDADLQKLSRMTGITDPQDLLAYINKTSDTLADNKLVKLATGSLTVDKGKMTSNEALRKASESVGGGVYDDSAIETKHLTHDEKMRASIGVQEDARARISATNKLKSGILDFSGYQSTMNALDNKEVVDKFSKAVDKFASKVEGDSAPKSFLERMLGSDKLPGSDNQRDLSNSSGNRR